MMTDKTYKKLKRVLALLLCTLTLLSVAACKGNGDGTQGESDTSVETADTDGGWANDEKITYELELVNEGKSEYRIIYPRLSGSSVYGTAERLRDMIFNYTGASLELSDDSAAESKYEILVGQTSRAQSKEVTDTLRANDYKIEAFENKLVLCGGNEEALNKALSKFLDNVVYVRGKRGATAQSLKVSSADDVYFAYKYPVAPSFNVNGSKLKDFGIVYESGSTYAEYTAYVLQRAILEKVGYSLEVYSDEDFESDKEILVGMTSRTDGSISEDAFAVKVQENKLCVMFKDLIGYEQAVDYVRDELLGGSVSELKADFSKEIDLTKTLTGSERSILGNEGDVRIITTNIYQAYDFYTERMKFLNMVYSEYAPDVILLQEAGYVSWSKSETKSIHALLAANGYETVLGNAGEVRRNHDDIGGDGTTDKHNATPLVYNKKTLELVDSGYHIYSLENNGHSKSFTWGVFRVKATGKLFIAFSTHFMYTPDADQAEYYDNVRVQNAVELAEKIKSLTEEYDCPAFGGGDINGYITSKHCKKLMDEGFVHVRDIADVTDTHIGTCSPDDIPDTETGFFFDNLTEAHVAGEIDLLFAYGEESDYRILVHDILIHDFAVAASDHTPVLIDIKLN